jgi:hypothetical protein
MLKKIFNFLKWLVKFYIDTYIQIFIYLYKNFFWDFLKFLTILFQILQFLSGVLFRFTVNRLRTLRLFLKDCLEVLPFFFKHPDSFAEYNMVLTRKQSRKQRLRRSIFNHLCVFALLSFFLLFFYDIADEDQFLFLYEFHKWW